MRYPNARIENGKLYGVKFSEYFTVQIGNDNPSICPMVDFDHMPIEMLVKLAFDAMKVKGRPAMKKLSIDELKRIYAGEISWRVLVSREGAAQHQSWSEMSLEEMEAEISKRRAAIGGESLKPEEPAAADDDIEDLRSDDINSDEYVPAGDDN